LTLIHDARTHEHKVFEICDINRHAACRNKQLKEMAVCNLTELLEWLRVRISFYPI